MRVRWLHAASLAGALAALLVPSRAEAYVWMMKHRYAACATCHVDPSGGELLTPYGRAQGELLLRTRYGSGEAGLGATPASSADVSSFDSFDSFDEPGAAQPEPQSAAPARPSPPEAAPAAGAGDATPDSDAARANFLWSLQTPDWLALGGSLRLAGLARPSSGSGLRVFPMQADLYGALFFGRWQVAGSVGLSRVAAGSPYARAAQLTTDQGEALNALSRSHWVGYALGRDWLLRAGRLNMPFGLRIAEHVMWVRSETQTDRDSDQEHGVALAYTGAHWRGEVMAIAGNYQLNPDRYRQRGYSAFVELLALDSLSVGASSLVTHAQADLAEDVNEPTTRQAHGVFSRWTPNPVLSVLVEADALLRTRRQVGYTGLLQGDFEVTQGLHLLLSGEVLDSGYEPDRQWFLQRRRPGNGLPRFAGWAGAQWFFFSHLDLRLDTHYRQPQTSAQTGSVDVLAQLHAYL